MAKKGRTNPQKRPATAADVKRAKDEAIRIVWAIFFTVMRDKEGYGNRRLKRLWDEVNALADSVSKGYVSIKDLTRALKEEADIEIM